MKFDVMAIGVSFIITLILALIGLYVPFLTFLAPIIGGLVAAYMFSAEYMDGAINPGLGAGIAGFIYTLIAVLIFGGAVMAATGTTASAGVLGAAAIIGAIAALVIDFILGAIGGVIGVVIKAQMTGGEAAS